MDEVRHVSDVPAALRNQVSQPLSPDLIAQQQALADRNAGRDFREDLAAAQQVRDGQPAPPRPRGIAAKVRQQVGEFFGGSEQTGPETTVPVAVQPVPAALPSDPEAPALPPPEPWQPAASDSDSPSRGIPRPITDEGKKITGGFGGVGPAQYFPLDGHELGVILCQKLDELKKRIQNDLRFSQALTYPRVQMFLEVEVRGFADLNSDFTVKTVPYDPKGEHKGSTPVEVAREYGNEMVFVLLDAHIEMTPDGESLTPPNKARLAAGLQVPQMQRVESPGGGFLVDRV